MNATETVNLTIYSEPQNRGYAGYGTYNALRTRGLKLKAQRQIHALFERFRPLKLTKLLEPSREEGCFRQAQVGWIGSLISTEGSRKKTSEPRWQSRMSGVVPGRTELLTKVKVFAERYSVKAVN